MHEFAVARRRMVREQISGAGITDPRVLQAMEDVPRHLFVPKVLSRRAHQPSALPIGYGQTISKPFTVGLMTALLELQGHEKVLEVTAGQRECTALGPGTYSLSFAKLDRYEPIPPVEVVIQKGIVAQVTVVLVAE